MTTAELLTLRIRQLEKRPEDIAQAAAVIQRSRFRSKEHFEKIFNKRIKNYVFKKGDLVLIRNSRVEKELDKKTKPRYLGPYEIYKQTNGGSYVIKELNGAISRRGIAQFRIIPYISRNERIFENIELEQEEEIEERTEIDQDDEETDEEESEDL